MDIKLVKSLNEELIEIIEETQKKIKSHSITDKEFLEFIKKVREKNSLIAEEIDSPTDSWQ